VTVVPGVHADFSSDGKLIGIEVIDASEVMGRLEPNQPKELSQCYQRDERDRPDRSAGGSET